MREAKMQQQRTIESELGARIKQYPLASRRGLAIGLGIFVLAGITIGIAAFRASGFDLGLLGILSFALVLLGVVLVLSSGGETSLTFYENGLVKHSLWKQYPILWKDIAEIQFGFQQTAHRTNWSLVIIPFFVPIRVGSTTSTLLSGSCAVRLQDGSAQVISGYSTLLELRPVIEDAIYPRLTEEAFKRFNKGENIRLHRRIVYSNEGIEGTRIKGTRRHTRSVPFTIPWEHFSGTRQLEGRFSLLADRKRVVTVPSSEIINPGVFKAIVSKLREEGRTPLLG